MENKNIKFIRVRGRIIPIKEKNKDIVKGSALLVGGVGATIGGSYYAGNKIKEARDLRSKAFIGRENILSSGSSPTNLKNLRLLKRDTGKIVGMGGRISKVKPYNPTMFDLVNDIKAKDYAFDKRVSAYKSAFKSRTALRYSHSFAHAAVGLGVDKFIGLTGLEKNLGNEYISEMAGIGTFAATTSLGENIYKKRAYGQSLREGFKNDIIKNSSKIKNYVKNLGTFLIKRKLKIK